MTSEPAEAAEAHQLGDLTRLRRVRDRFDREYASLIPRKHVLAWLFGMAFGLVVQSPSWGRDDLDRWLPDLVVGWALLSCGLVATRKRSGVPMGDLLLAAGFAWFLPDLSGLTPDRVASVLSLTLFWHRGPLLHAVLAYPTGRITSRPTAAAVVMTYAAAFLQPVWRGDGLAVAATVLVLLSCALRYAGAPPSRRRAGLFALVAAIAWAASIGSGELIRSTALSVGAKAVLLLAYECTVCAIAVALIIGLRAGSSEQSVVTDLVLELGTASAGDIRGRLADALGDPGLVVGYWDAGTGSYVDGAGQQLSEYEAPSGRNHTVVKKDGQPLALIVHDPVVLYDPALVAAVSAATRLVAAHARLQAEVQARVAEVTASRRRILDSADEERGRLERRVQAGALRPLDELAALLGHARTTAAGEDTAALIEVAQSQLVRAVEELRQLARGIHPRDLAEHGLEAALAGLTLNVALPVELAVSPGPASLGAQACVYFVCSEALANATKYAEATVARIRVQSGGGRLLVEIADDGVGGAVAGPGTGLQGLADRVETLGGTIDIVSPPGEGTRIVASIPTGSVREP